MSRTPLVALLEDCCMKPGNGLQLIVAVVTLAVTMGCGPGSQSSEAGKVDGNRQTNIAQKAQALYEEKCRTVAGEKIYRTVPDVEGIVLLKVRPQAGPREQADLMWPGAAFALEATGDEFISTFLGYEQSSRQVPVTPEYRGYINSRFVPDNPSNLPGYRYVDVVDEKSGKRYRYALAKKPRPTSQIGWVDVVLDKALAPDPAPRYGVTFEDHVIPEERAMGLASSTVKVIDLQTNEVLGEMLRYARGAIKASSANPTPWLSAYKCPGHPVGAEAATRKFADQILIPAKEK